MKNKFNPGFTYILLWCLYNLQGTFYASGGIISQTLLLTLLIWSIYHFFIVNINQSQNVPTFIKAINIFLIMATIYGSILMLSGQELYITEGEYKKVPNFSYLKEVLTSLLPIYPIYNYTRKGYINQRNIGILLLLLVGVAWGQYFRFQTEAVANAMAEGYIREEFTNNTGYSFLALLPLLLIWNKKPLLQYVLFLICIGGIIICMKRGAIIIGAVCAIYFIYSSLKTAKGSTKFAIVILSALAIIATISIVRDLLVTSDYFVYRIEQTLEGNSSNRDIIYSHLWDTFINESNPLILLFGRGANATLTVAPNLAHNDWLELITNQGIIGIVIYLWFYIAMLKDIKKIKHSNTLYARVLFMSFIVLFLRTIFSMSYGDIDIVLMLAIGFVLGSSNMYARRHPVNISA